MSSRIDRHWVWLICAAPVAVTLYGGIPYWERDYAHWDLFDYLAMAEASPGLAADVSWPFAFRVFGPYLAGLLPISEPAAFRLLSVVASIALALLFYGFLRTRCRPPVAALTVGLFCLNKHLFGYAAWNHFQLNDVLASLSVLGLFWALTSQRWTAFGVCLLLGVTARETPLIMLPVAAIYLFEKGSLRTAGWRLALACLPALAVFATLRLLIPTDAAGSLAHAFVTHARKLGRLEVWLRLLGNTFVPLTLVPLVFWRTSVSFFRRRRVYALVFLGLVFAGAAFGSNNERLMAPSFVVFYWLMAVIVEDHLRRRPVVLAVLMAGAVLAMLDHRYALYRLPDRMVTLWISALALGVVTAACLGAQLRPGKAEEGGPVPAQSSP